MTYPKPFGARILVRPIETSESDFIVPDTSKEPPQKGEVVAVGDNIPLTKDGIPVIRVGDIIHYSRYATEKIEIDDQIFIYMRTVEQDIFGIL